MSELFVIGVMFILIAVLLHFVWPEDFSEEPHRLTPFQFVYRVFDGDLDKVNLWFSSANPYFGGLSPDALVFLKGSKPLISFTSEIDCGEIK